MKCKQCGREIDQQTIEFFQRKRPNQQPRICGICIVIAFDNLSIECSGEPLFPENWQVIENAQQRPGERGK